MTKNTKEKTAADAAQAQATAIELAKATMAGDLIAATIDELKAAPNVWQKMTEKQQEEAIYRVTNRVVHNITQAVTMIAAEARPVIRAKLVGVNIKDDIKASVLVSRHHTDRHRFIDSSGQEILIVLLDVDQFTGGAGDIKPDPDQGSLPLEQVGGVGAESKEPEDGEEEGVDEMDPLLKEALDFVIKHQKASITALKSGLKIGYNRAQNLIAELENRGVVGPIDHAGQRAVLVSEQ